MYYLLIGINIVICIVIIKIVDKNNIDILFLSTIVINNEE